ncbi:PAS domain S-box protein [Noviherbaspirillum malthae]|uniref:PAS domain S-box protein n=1 Tax=Noviherbaspirillum malthae TaxID=1260987 RepID=UPI00188F18EB|nr:PAS domain S-box protein [Noviherbaspirillum malthae]
MSVTIPAEFQVSSATSLDNLILESITDFAVIAMDSAGHVLRWNEGACRILGWTAEEMVGQHVSRFFTPEDAAVHQPQKEMQQARLFGRGMDERWHVRKSGERFWASGEMMPLKGNTGQLIGFVKVLRDQTEQKLAIIDIVDQNEQLEDKVTTRTQERDRVWRNSLDLMLSIGADGIVRTVNPAWTSTLGYELNELVGQHFAPFVHVDDIPATSDAITTASRTPVERFEVRLKHKDGSYRWFAWRAAPEEGIVYANGRDITIEKKQAEQLRLASRARLQLAMAAGEMGAWEWNIQTNTIVWLHGAAAVHGIAPADENMVFPVEHYVEHVHPDDRRKLVDVMERAVSEGKNHHAEYRVVWPDGSAHWIEARGEMFFDESDKPAYMVGVSVDITRQKRSEQDSKFLAHASNELAQLIDPQSTLDRLAYLAVPFFADWCAIDILEGEDTLRRVAVAHVDPSKVRLALEIHHRFPPDPKLSQGIWSVVRTGRPQMVHELTDELLAQYIKEPERLTIMREVGIRSFLSVPLTARGKTMGVITFFAAESGRRYEQADLILAEELGRRAAIAIENANLYRAVKESDQAKDVFLATLSHELRNPLAAIVSALNLLTITPDDKEKVTKYIKMMERQAGHLTHLVDDLMDVARISNGKIELKKEASSLAGILNNAIETCSTQMEKGGHRLSLTLPGEATPIHADHVRLTQVFSNLLSNATKYTPTGGQISVILEHVDSDYVVSIRDTGVGIPSDMLKNVFNLFTQVNHPLQYSEGGLGIGLALVEGIVSLHGGKVEAFSDGSGKGSTFIVRLPLDMPLPASASELGGILSTSAVQATEKKRILVVDDNVDAALTTGEILRILGHEVDIAHDGLTAVSAAGAGNQDIILMDIGLPGIDGYEAARRIRAQQQGSTSRSLLIAVTGWGQEKDKELAFDAGFDLHWVKPVTLEKLKELLEASNLQF